MRTPARRTTAQLGELIAAVFDGAAHYSSDPREVSRLGTITVRSLLQRMQARRPGGRPAPLPAACP